MTIAQTWMEKGLDEGMEKGRKEGLVHLIHRRFGILEFVIEDRIRALSIAKLEQILDDFFNIFDRMARRTLSN